MRPGGCVDVHVPVVVPGAARGPAAELWRYRFFARERLGVERDATIAVHFGEEGHRRPFHEASALLHDAANGRLRPGGEASRAAELVVKVTGPHAAVEGRSGMLGAACGELAARWVRPSAPDGARLPALVATGRLAAVAGGEPAGAGEALEVGAVDRLDLKLAAVAAALDPERGGFRGRALVVAVPAANLVGDGADGREPAARLRALEAPAARAGCELRVVAARTLADVVEAWVPVGAWISGDAAALFGCGGPPERRGHPRRRPAPPPAFGPGPDGSSPRRGHAVALAAAAAAGLATLAVRSGDEVFAARLAPREDGDGAAGVGGADRNASGKAHGEGSPDRAAGRGEAEDRIGPTPGHAQAADPDQGPPPKPAGGGGVARTIDGGAVERPARGPGGSGGASPAPAGDGSLTLEVPADGGPVRVLRDGSVIVAVKRAVLLSLGVLAAALGVRHLGGLQPLELRAYDALLSLQRLHAQSDPRVTLVAVSEADIVRHGWPLTDDVLADLLERLLRHGPRAIGIDIFRDRPEPPGHERLSRLLREDGRLIAVMKHRGAESVGVLAPPAIEDPSRVGFADMVVDPDGIVRRGLLFLGGGEHAGWSLGLRLAVGYLAGSGVAPAGDERDPHLLRLGAATYVPLEGRGGGYAAIDSGGYQLLLTYPAGLAGFATVTLGQILDGELAPDVVRDRIVILGTHAESVRDSFFTPLLGGRDQPGLELHAQISSQLVRQALGESWPLRPVPWPLDAAWIALWCGVGGAAALALRSRFPLVLAALAGTAVLCASAFGLFLVGHWVPLAAPLVGGFASLFVQAGRLVRLERRERAVLMRLFSAHLSPRVAEAVWRERRALLGRGGPRPQSLEATVLFSDVRDFTVVSEMLTPAILMAWLDEYVASMTEVVVRHGGGVLELMGDGLLAVFGIPVPRTSPEAVSADARDAVRCALSMGEALTALNARFRARGLPEATIRVGIHTGPLVAGRLGSEARCKYAVVGSTVNVAAQLEQYGKDDRRFDRAPGHCRILISGATYACLRGEHAASHLGRLKLKGNAASVAVYHLPATATDRPRVREGQGDGERRQPWEADEAEPGRPGACAWQPRPGSRRGGGG